MKKSAIAVAVAAVLAAPVALAEVSISGGLQAELRSVGGEGTTLRKGLYATDGGETLVAAASRENGGNYGFLKFAASEDLGDGMKALAVWTGNINVGDTNAAGGITGRDAFVGLSAGWGTVLAGTLSTPYKSSTVGWDPMVATSLQARGNGGMSDAHNSYASNALAYANAFGGVKVVAAIVLDEGNEIDANGAAVAGSTKTNGKNAISFSVNAPVGPVEVAVAYVNADKFSDMNNLGLGGTVNLLTDLGAAAVSLDTLTATKAGVKWASGDFTVAGQYEMLKLKAYGATDSIDPTVLYVTGSYKMGNNTISAAYGDTKWDVTNLDNTKYMMVALNHAFSKTTNAFVGYRSTDMGNMFGANTTTKETSVSAGLRVNF